MECPSSDRWTAFASGIGTPADRAQLSSHAASCATCRDVLSGFAVAETTVAQTADPGAAPTAVAPPKTVLLAAGTRVGRYVIERALGAGGMGVVYVARDPELARNVAIKLLRAGAPSQRLRREAQALAKLDHPNVVGVHDVGEHDGQSFVAMALVDGRNLRQWRSKRRSTREVIRVIIEAGRGLAAAHAAGLIHRDLKPDNIFISDRGQVVVGDFGLARSAEDADADESTLSAADTGLTIAGALVGTPAYMAPEQARGEPTVASDQFALCVTAWETLYGTRPFTGTTHDEVIEAASHGKIVEPPHAARVPKRVRRALERGLAVDPDARWPSIDALLVELAGDRARRRWTIALAAAGVAVVLAAAWGVARLTSATVSRCRSADDRLAEAWTPARASEIRDAVVRVAPYAGPSLDRTLKLLDDYAQRWRRSWDDTCRAETAPTGFDLRVACLEQRLHSLASAADALRGTDRSSARYVLDVATDLPSIDHCDDLASLGKIAPPPVALAARVAAVDRDIASGDTLAHAGRYHQADEILRRTQREADALGYPATQARAELALGTLLMLQDHLTEAKPRLEAALNHAIAASDDETTARSYLGLTGTAVSLADAPRARELDATADAALRRIGDPPELRAKLTVLDATLPAMTGDYPEALARVSRAIPKLEAARLYKAASSLYRLHSALLTGLGRRAEARAGHDHEVDSTRELLGATHPSYGEAVIARGTYLFNEEAYAAAAADYEVGYKTLVDALGPTDVITIQAGAEVANLDALFGRWDKAISKLRLAADAVEDLTGPQNTASARRSLAEALMLARRYDEAEHELGLASELDRKLEGPYLLADELDLAILRFRQGKVDEAKAMVERVRPDLIKTLGADNPALGDVWILLSRIAIAQGQPATAVTLLAKVTLSSQLAEAKIVLAQALDRQGNKAGAAALRKAALELLDKIGPGARPDLRAESASAR
jgi:predicted Ser/Thr protein kinase/tetratricopeptide (TPR) repeat protein